MKKSIFAMFFVLFALLNVPVSFAEDLPEVSAATDEAPLPPLMEDDASGK